MSLSKRFLSIPLLLIIIILLSLSEGVNIQPSSNVVSEPAIGIGNPAAVYCLEMGYEHKIIEGESGQEGMCILPDGESCQEWDFLNGKCGQSHSFCASQGLDLVTIRDGNNPFSLEYAVCLSPNGKQVGPLMDLMGLESKTAGCGEDFQQIPPTRVDGVTVDYAPNPDAAPPSTFDWRNYAGSNWMTPVKNQGGCGSCWAFSAVGVSEAAHNIGTNDPTLDLDLSEQYLVSDCHNIWGYQTCCGGWKDIALKYIRDTGIPDESCMSYVDGASCSCGGDGCETNCTYRILGDCSDSSCSDRCGDWSSRSVNITSTGYVGTNPTNIKQALVDYGPLAVSVGIGSFYGGSWDGDIYRCSDDGGTNHAVAIVGYDDSGGYWWVRNSWGSGWNVDGHYKVGYGECSIEKYVYYAVAVPEMDLQGNSLSISDGDVTPSLSDHTDFGGVNTMVGTITRTFTIENTGTANLNLTGSTKVTLGGPQAGDFSVISQPSTPVAFGGGTTTFQVEFDPGSSGTREATVSIANNDSDENPYTFDIQGTGTEPEIDLQGNGQSIPAGNTSPSLADHSDFGNASVSGGFVIRTFTVVNSGTADLTLTDSPKVDLSGTQAGDFSVILQPTSPVAQGGGTTTFQVEFNPSGSGIRDASISIANNDPDENPYNFDIQGTGTAPEIDLKGNGFPILDGDSSPALSDHTDFGNAIVAGEVILRTFTIENTGNEDLLLTDSPKVVISGAQAGDFSVTSQPSTPVAFGGGTTTFQVEFDPGSSGTREATVSIANNDSDENPYTFDIQGTGTEPEIDLQGNGQSIPAGNTSPSLADHSDFGNVRVSGGFVIRTFTVVNSGTADLTLTDSPKVDLSGAQAGDFSVILQPTSPVAQGGGTTTFQVKFNPTGIGIRQATIIIANDDSDENPYIFSIQGTGTEPEINLRGNGQSILNGDITPSFTDHTDFGSASLSSGMITRTFTIENTGTEDLDLSGLPEVTLSGAHGGDFSITSQPTSPVSSGGGTASFQVEFDPSSSGIRVATISIANNDSDENPYTFDIQGTGIEPEMDILGNGQSIPDRDITPSFSDHTDFGTANVSWGTATRTFTIKNTGTEELLLNGIPKVDLIGADAGDFTIVNQPVSPILSGGGTTTFQVLFNPTDAGIRETTVSITNNDNDENPYTFTIHGTGTITFPDVLPSFWAFDWVEAIAAAGLTSGYPDGTYRPENQVTRAEMATFLLRGMGASAPPVDGSHPFSDITGHWAEIFIEELYDQGITEGYPDGTYRPENQVTRAEMAVFLLKGIGSTPLPLDGSHPFPDIAGHWAEIFIEELFDQAITGGYPDGTYRPENRVTRAEMAVFLVNTFNIPLP